MQFKPSYTIKREGNALMEMIIVSDRIKEMRESKNYPRGGISQLHIFLKKMCSNSAVIFTLFLPEWYENLQMLITSHFSYIYREHTPSLVSAQVKRMTWSDHFDDLILVFHFKNYIRGHFSFFIVNDALIRSLGSS